MSEFFYDHDNQKTTIINYGDDAIKIIPYENTQYNITEKNGVFELKNYNKSIGYYCSMCNHRYYDYKDHIETRIHQLYKRLSIIDDKLDRKIFMNENDILSPKLFKYNSVKIHSKKYID
jgi:hypothetical protein